MDVTLEELNRGVTRAGLAGRLDHSGAETVDIKLGPVWKAGEVRLAVDLSDVTFISSIGIRSLFMNAKGVNDAGGRMALVNPNPLVARVLETTGVEKLIPVYAGIDEAVDALLD